MLEWKGRRGSSCYIKNLGQKKQASYCCFWMDHYTTCSEGPDHFWRSFSQRFLLCVVLVPEMKPAVLRQVLLGNLKASSSKALPAILYVPKHSYYSWRDESCRWHCFADTNLQLVTWLDLQSCRSYMSEMSTQAAAYVQLPESEHGNVLFKIMY